MQDIALTEIDSRIAEQTDELPGQWTEIGWLPPDDLSRDDWMGIAPKLSGVLTALHWWIGDWVVHGEAKFGEMAAQVIDATDFEYNTISKDAWVARSIPYDQRRHPSVLSYTHHRSLASSDITPAERAKLMDMAIEHGWTSKLTLAFKMQWVQRREKLLLAAREDGRQEQAEHVPETLPEEPTVEQVMRHLDRMDQDRRAVSVDSPKGQTRRRGTGFPQIYNRDTGELTREWKQIWPRICDDCRDSFMTAERDAWTTEDDNAEPGGQDSST